MRSWTKRKIWICRCKISGADSTLHRYIASCEQSQEAFFIPKNKKGDGQMIRVFDAFSGIGGFRSTFERVGGFKTVGWCEIDSATRS